MKKRFIASLIGFSLAGLIVVPTIPVRSAKAACATATINGQCIFTDTHPTISACGATPAYAATSTSNGGTITVGARIGNLPVTQCTLTFDTAFTAAPNLVVTGLQRGLTAFVLSQATTKATIGFSGDAAGQKFNYLAF